MAGVNDPVFRRICKRLGADLTYTEMISAKGLSYNTTRTERMLSLDETESPVAVQLFGKDPHTLAEQAQALEASHGADIALIDINMGCPARKIAGKGEGAALMRDPELAAAILRAVVGAVKLPVTVKFRKGYELDADDAVAFAQRAEQCGVAAVAVHGRTAQQFYHGRADRALIGRVRQAVTIPVIASGDVFTPDDIRAYFEEQGADAVMVARGAQGNPWIFSASEPTLEERVRIAWEHTEGLHGCQPQRLASMRKHVSWYFCGVSHAATIRRLANDCVTLLDYQALFEQILAWR